jgi:hypothetical protein
VPTAKSASRFTSAVFDSDDLARLDGLEVSEANGHERNEVFEKDGFTTENHDHNFPMSKVMLVFKSAIHSQENVELRGLGCGQELTVLKSRKASIPGGLTFRARRDSCAVLRSHTRRGGRVFMPGPTATVELLPARRWPSRVKRSDTLREILQGCGPARGN